MSESSPFVRANMMMKSKSVSSSRTSSISSFTVTSTKDCKVYHHKSHNNNKNSTRLIRLQQRQQQTTASTTNNNNNNSSSSMLLTRPDLERQKDDYNDWAQDQSNDQLLRWAMLNTSITGPNSEYMVASSLNNFAAKEDDEVANEILIRSPGPEKSTSFRRTPSFAVNVRSSSSNDNNRNHSLLQKQEEEFSVAMERLHKKSENVNKSK